jgi:hypothetical protein
MFMQLPTDGSSLLLTSFAEDNRLALLQLEDAYHFEQLWVL